MFRQRMHYLTLVGSLLAVLVLAGLGSATFDHDLSGESKLLAWVVAGCTLAGMSTFAGLIRQSVAAGVKREDTRDAAREQAMKEHLTSEVNRVKDAIPDEVARALEGPGIWREGLATEMAARAESWATSLLTGLTAQVESLSSQQAVLDNELRTLREERAGLQREVQDLRREWARSTVAMREIVGRLPQPADADGRLPQQRTLLAEGADPTTAGPDFTAEVRGYLQRRWLEGQED